MIGVEQWNLTHASSPNSIAWCTWNRPGQQFQWEKKLATLLLQHPPQPHQYNSGFIDRSFPQVPPPPDTGSGFSPISLIISVGKITVTDDVTGTGTAHPSCWCPSAGMALQRENGREGVGRWPNGL